MDVTILWAEHVMLGNEVLSDNRKWEIIVSKAQILLDSSDKTQLPDSGLSCTKQMEWREYRDDLRSIRDDFATPDSVVFPTPPAEE